MARLPPSLHPLFCPVCGFAMSHRTFTPPPRFQGLSCPCCATRYGEDDLDLLLVWVGCRPGARLYLLPTDVQTMLYQEAWTHLRGEWIRGGMRVWEVEAHPRGWRPQIQLAVLRRRQEVLT